MPSQLALELAHKVKTTVNRTSFDNVDPIPVSQWFHSGLRNMKTIPYSSISHYADEEYAEWRKVDPEIEYSFDASTKLTEWVTNTSVEDIAKLIDDSPPGVGPNECNEGSKFTAWQRLSMIFWVSPPYAVTSKMKINTETLRRMAEYNEHEMPRARKQPIMAEFSMLEGSMPDYGIIDLPTASWKTAWSLAVAYMLMSSRRYPFLRSEFRTKLLGSIFQGAAGLPVARMGIVAVSATTFDHFVSTLLRSIPIWKQMDPTLEFIVWTTMSKHNSIRAASNLPENHVVFWVIPVSKLNTVLRETPETAVAVCITDEYTVDTPKEKFRTLHSKVIKNMITQATPQALQAATRGNRSMLKELFGGYLYGPCEIARLVRHRNYSQAQIAGEQLCNLDLMTLTHFRDHIRMDLTDLVPSSLQVNFVKSKRFTMSSFLLSSQVDMVPASFSNVLLKCVRGLYFTQESMLRFQQSIQAPVITPPNVISALETLRNANPSTLQVAATSMDRLISRIQEFSSACPICMMDNPDGVNIFGCCGYCVCNDCFDACNSRCAFCRTTVPSSLRRSDVAIAPEVVDLTEENNVDTAMYPLCPTFTTGSFSSDLQSVVSFNKRQATNLTVALHTLVHHNFKRLLILIERDRYNERDLSESLDIQQIATVTGIDVQRIDTKLRGKGTEFAKIKKTFDKPNATPMGLLSFGMDPTLLIGTNFDQVDAMVTVGSIDTSILTQAINRIFRPRATRDNSRPMVMVKIYS